LRQEAHADSVFARLRQGVARSIGPLANQRIGNLDENPRAIAQQRISAHRTAMVELFEDLQRLRNDRVAFLSLDMRNHADAAGVMFVGGVIETLGGGVSHWQKSVLSDAERREPRGMIAHAGEHA